MKTFKRWVPPASRDAVLFLLIITHWICLPGCGAVKSGSAGEGAWNQQRQKEDLEILRLIGNGDYSGVLEATERLMASGVTDDRLKGQRALALGKMGRSGEAIALFEESLLGEYENCENHLNFAVLLMELGKTGRALTEFNEARRFCGRSEQGLIMRNLAVANLKMGNEQAALKKVEEGLEMESEDPYLLGLKGMLVAEAHPSLAESLFAVADRKGGLTDDFLYQLGLLFLKTGRPSRAIMPLEKIIGGGGGDREVRLNYAEALIRSRKFEQAEEFLQGFTGEEGGGERDEKLARVFFRLERFEEAARLYRALPQTPENSDRLAMSLHRLGRSQEALQIQRKVVAERPEWTVGLINLSAILAALGELEEAESTLVKVLEIEPDNAIAVVNLDILRREMEGSGRK